MRSKPVVVGIDDFQPELFRFALHEARRMNTGLRVVHVLNTTELHELRGRDHHQLFDQLREVAAAELDPPEVTYFSWPLDAADILIVESREACEVVLGTDEVPWLSRVAGAEVARRVSMESACPVIVVPPHQPGVQGTDGIVVAIDASERIDAVLRFAFEAAVTRGESVQVIEAAGPRAGYVEREVRRNRLDDLVAPWIQRYPGVRVRPSVSGTRAVSACVLATQRASLLILGRPRAHHTPMSLNAVAVRVLRRAQAPVAVVPLDEPVGVPA